MPGDEEPLLMVSNIHRTFGTAAVLDGVSMMLHVGTLTVLTGTNGSGKTTLVNCMTGFDLIHEGQVLLNGKILGKMPADSRARLGLIRTFQYPHVFPGLTVREHLALGQSAGLSALPSYFRKWSGNVPKEVVEELDLGSLLDRRGDALSFGEMKVVNTARALATGGRVFFFDEPFASLHGKRRQQVLDALARRRDAGCAILVIEHETGELDGIANAKYEIVDGKLVERNLS